MKKANILYLDDDSALRIVVAQYLEDEGYEVCAVGSGRELDEALKSFVPDVVLLDLTLPDCDGLSVLTRLRATSSVPVIITSGKSETTERIIGIEMGADDYLTKPFDMREMMARIKAQLRRRAVPPAPETGMVAAAGAPDAVVTPAAGTAEVIEFAGMRLDRNTYQVYDTKGQSLNFTSGEFRLLEGLLLARNRVLSREQLFGLTREGEFLAFDRAIDIQISRIRKKLGDDGRDTPLIQTVRGVGYMYAEKQGSKAG